MRNMYPGTCYRCGKHCAAGEGHFERKRGGWRVQHAKCAIVFRGTKIRHTDSRKAKSASVDPFS